MVEAGDGLVVLSKDGTASLVGTHTSFFKDLELLTCKWELDGLDFHN